MSRSWMVGAALVVGLAASAGWAKLPPPTEEQKAKADEAKAKAAEAAKMNAEALGRVQDQVAERYIRQMKEKGVEVKPTPIAPPSPAATASPPAAPPIQAAKSAEKK